MPPGLAQPKHAVHEGFAVFVDDGTHQVGQLEAIPFGSTNIIAIRPMDSDYNNPFLVQF